VTTGSAFPVMATKGGPPRRVLILKPCCLGDLVQTTSVIAAVHQHWPAAAITVATGPWSAAAVAHHPAVSDVVDIGNLGLRGKQRPAELLRLWPAFRRRHFDVAIVPDRSPVLAVLVWLAAVPVRAGYNSAGRGRLYTIGVRPVPNLHELDQAQRLLALLGMPELPLPQFFAGRMGREEADAIVRTLPAGRPLALLAPGGGENPGTSMPGKRWSAGGYTAVAAALQEAGATVALVGAGTDRAVANAVAAQGTTLHDLVGKTSLAALGALAAQSSVFVGNDSGITHLAAATGCPTVAIFGPTEPRLYAPRGQSVRVVSPAPSLRIGGEGSVRRPYVFARPWQEHLPADVVCEAAVAVLLSRRSGDC